jgi:hypothetical protein
MFSSFSEFGTLMNKVSALIKINRKTGEGISYITTVSPNAWAEDRRTPGTEGKMNLQK